MNCRIGCGACCVAPSISSPIPGMPQGKPAGTRCVHLSIDDRCRIYHDPGRPVVCDQFTAAADMCGASREEALQLLSQLEMQTRT